MSETSDFGGGSDGGSGGSDSGYGEAAPPVDVSPESGRDRGWEDSRELTSPSLDPDFYTPTLDATGASSDLRQRTTQPALKGRFGGRRSWPTRVDAVSRVLTEREKREEAEARRELELEVEAMTRRRTSPWIVAAAIAALGALAGSVYVWMR